MVRVFCGRRRDVSVSAKEEHGKGLSLLGNGNGEFITTAKNEEIIVVKR